MLGADFTRGRATAGLVLSHSRGEGGYRSPAGRRCGRIERHGALPLGALCLERAALGLGRGGLRRGHARAHARGRGAHRDRHGARDGGARRCVGCSSRRRPRAAGWSSASRRTRWACARRRRRREAQDGGNLAGAQGEGHAATPRAAKRPGTASPRAAGRSHRASRWAFAVTGAMPRPATGWTSARASPGRMTSAASRRTSGARGLLTHEADGFGERGFSGTLTFDPEPSSERGLSLSLIQTVGTAASGGADALLGRGHLDGLAANDDGAGLGQRRLEARLGYGFALFGGAVIGTPELGLGLSDAGRDYRLGWRFRARAPRPGRPRARHRGDAPRGGERRIRGRARGRPHGERAVVAVAARRRFWRCVSLLGWLVAWPMLAAPETAMAAAGDATGRPSISGRPIENRGRTNTRVTSRQIRRTGAEHQHPLTAACRAAGPSSDDPNPMRHACIRPALAENLKLQFPYAASWRQGFPYSVSRSNEGFRGSPTQCRKKSVWRQIARRR